MTTISFLDNALRAVLCEPSVSTGDFRYSFDFEHDPLESLPNCPLDRANRVARSGEWAPVFPAQLCLRRHPTDAAQPPPHASGSELFAECPDREPPLDSKLSQRSSTHRDISVCRVHLPFPRSHESMRLRRRSLHARSDSILWFLLPDEASAPPASPVELPRRTA